MDQLSILLQGGYAYLLIFQILVVSALFVILIVMMARRLKTEMLGLNASTAAASVSSGVSIEEYEKLKAALAALEEELKGLEKLKAENTELSEKVKFLESKLLEYEILQEEIGSLSNLKVENEKLKKEVLNLQKDISKTAVQVEGLSADTLVAPAGSPAEPKAAVSAVSSAVPIESSAPMIEPTAPVTVPIPAPANDQKVSENLDGLLAEIDALSAEANPSREGPKV